jgi:hypothetical protein
VDLVAAGISAQEKCTRQLAQTAIMNVKYLSSPPRVGRYIARIVSPSTGNPGIKIFYHSLNSENTRITIFV